MNGDYRLPDRNVLESVLARSIDGMRDASCLDKSLGYTSDLTVIIRARNPYAQARVSVCTRADTIYLYNQLIVRARNKRTRSVSDGRRFQVSPGVDRILTRTV
jgi:hypothetical protein